MRFTARFATVAWAIFVFTSGAIAKPVTLGRTETSTDYVSSGVGGLGSGPGTITITGVEGPVRKAFLYWQGIDNGGTGAVYDNPTIDFNGTSITGVSLGDAETNCWGPGSSRAFFADVTNLVAGNGDYTISGLNGGTNHFGNGASLIVLFNDNIDANDRDLVFFEGNDSDFIQFAFPGETAGWHATLPGIDYTGGSVFAQIHASDGQSFGDGPITFTGASAVTFQDTATLWDGHSLPNAGSGRAGADGLWDIHTFDITAAFGAPGIQTINFDGMEPTADCHSLVVMMLDLGAGSAPCGNGILDSGEECDPAGGASTDCEGATTCLNDCTCGCTNDFQCNDGATCTNDSCNVETGECVHESTCPTGPGCADTCDDRSGECRLCGHPFRNDRCVVNAVVVLQGALGLRPCELCLCDVNGSQTVTASDALRILRSCAGLSVNFRCTGPGD
ncbi:MAG TPA: hypothetical protein VN634_09560 [Candidatus Limnocylindrales bacterium]|nr:hypothetical protein [Candidatus Limnocylindrales bacterium]